MQLEFVENQVIVWQIESPKAMRRYIAELLEQCNGNEGKFVLSDGNHILDIGQNVEVIVNPFSVDVNDKKITNKLVSAVKELAFDEERFVATQELFSGIQNFFFELEQELTGCFSYANTIDISQLFKSVGMQFETENNGLECQLDEYMTIAGAYLHKRIFVIINASLYFTQDEIQTLLNHANYMKWCVLLVEGRDIELNFSHRRYIIDANECEIY